MAAVFLVSFTRGYTAWGNVIDVGLMTTDNEEFASLLKALIEGHPGDYHATIKRLPTHDD